MRPLTGSAEGVLRRPGATVPARLATLDRHGLSHVTPLWFVWADGAFYITSLVDRPRVRAIGTAELKPDHAATWTTGITQRYVRYRTRAVECNMGSARGPRGRARWRRRRAGWAKTRRQS